MFVYKMINDIHVIKCYLSYLEAYFILLVNLPQIVIDFCSART